jgi:cytochrome c oxidase subunit 4
MKGRESSIRRLVAVYLALLLLLALTASATALPPGWWSTPIGLAIACAKIFLIAYVFMNLRNQPGLVRIFAGAGLFWLMIMIALTSCDYITRAWPG